MRSFQLAALLALLCLGLLGTGGRIRFLAGEFPERLRRVAAGTLLLGILSVCVFYPMVSAGKAVDLDPSEIWFPDLFTGHTLLALFLVVWWRLRRDRSITRFLLLHPPTFADVERGLWVGTAGWALTILATAAVAALVRTAGLGPESDSIPAFMPWLAALPVWRKLIIIGVAMSVEEAFFRGFLQPRIGWLPSSLLFAVSHAGYGLPLLMVSVLIISLVIGWSLKRTGRLLPCIIAHGVFDAIQLLVIIPWAVKMLELG